MQAGLDVFAIDSPEHKELKDVERDLNLMEQVRYEPSLPGCLFQLEPASQSMCICRVWFGEYQYMLCW